MNSVTITEFFSEPPICEREILRYAGSRDADDMTISLMHSCITEIQDKLTYSVCYSKLPVTISDDGICDFGAFKARSNGLAKNLNGCSEAILFAATVGIESDRLIHKYGHLSPSRALMFQAIGAERIEALCDSFCHNYENKKQVSLQPRFSPGYGDLDINVQSEIFSVLDCSKRIGLTLNDSYLMSPSKSVTAFAGISSDKTEKTNDKCDFCGKSDCIYRRK